MTFAVPVFSAIGKSYKDLWKKKFDFKNQVKTTQKTDFGATLTTTGTLCHDQVSGGATFKYVDGQWGEFEEEVDTGSNKIWAKGILNEKVLHSRGTKVTLSGGFDPSSKEPIIKDSWAFKGEVEHSQDFFTVGASVTLGEEKKDKADPGIAANVAVSSTIGHDGLTVGGQVNFDQTQTLTDYAVGVQFEHGPVTATLLTENQAEVIKASYLHKVSAKYTVGAEYVSEERGKTLNFASEYRPDKSTGFKLRASTGGDLAGVVEHRLSDPRLSVNLSAGWKVKGSSNVRLDKVGVGLHFGDFD
jgi:hypothetical protein